MRNVRRVAGGNTVAVDKRAGEICLQHASGLLLVAAVNFQHAAVIKQRTGTDQRQRAFGIRVSVKPSVDKADIAAPCAALLFNARAGRACRPLGSGQKNSIEIILPRPRELSI